MKTTIIIPNLAGGKHFLQPPIDVLINSASLKKKGHECVVLDNRVTQHNFDDLLGKIPVSDLLIVNTAPYDFSQMYHFDYRLDYSVATVNLLKKKFPNIPLVLTGIHGSVRPDLMMRDTMADAILVGETDLALSQLVETLNVDGSFVNAKNIYFRDNGKVFTSPRDETLMHPSLERLVMPDYDAIDLNNYYGYELKGDKFQRINKWGVVLGSRGCAYTCKFCHNFFGNEVRFRDPESIAEELEALDKKYQARHIFFIDPNITFDKQWLAQITKGIRDRNIKLKWSAQTRFDLVDEPTLKDMASANCTGICYGLESYNLHILRNMDKGIDLGEIESAVAATRRAGMTPQMFVILGAPGETKTSLRNTINFLRENELPYIAIVYGLRFGSKFEEEYRIKYGKNLEWEDLVGLKGRVDNNLDELTLAKTVKYLGNQNVLRRNTEDPLFLLQ